MKIKRAHPFVQTMILNILRENQIEEKVFVKKVDYEAEFIPAPHSSNQRHAIDK